MTINGKADDNPESDKKSKEIDRKKWIIDKLSRYQDSHYKQICSNKEKFESFSNRKLSELSDTRNAILAMIGILVVIIIGCIPILLTKNQISNTEEIFAIIAIIMVFMVLTYFIAFFIKRQTRSRLLSIEKTIDDCHAIQNFMNGFLELCTFTLYGDESIELSQLSTLATYYIIIQGGIASSIILAYYDAFPKKSNDELYSERRMKLYDILIEHSYKTYHNNEAIKSSNFLNLFNKSESGGKLHEEFESIIKYLVAYKKKYLDPNGPVNLR
jgi:hypothetical protein